MKEHTTVMNAPSTTRRDALVAIVGALGTLVLEGCGGAGTPPLPAPPKGETVQPTPDPAVSAEHHAFAAIVSAARDDNIFVNRPWSKAPTYMSSTPYFRGGLVRGQGADADSLYQCVVLLGSSGTLSAPSGRATYGMVDGTTAWLYWGQGTADAEVPLYASVTPTGPNDYVDGVVAFPQVPASELGLTRTYPMVFSNPPVSVSGGSQLIDNGGHADVLGPITGNLTNLSRDVSSRRHKLHFRTDCRKWLAVTQAGPLWPTGYCIEVDRRMLTEGDVTHGVKLEPGYLLINMALFGPGEHDVVIRKFGEVTSTAVSLSVGPDESIWPADDNGFSVAIEGDSITQGGGIGSQSISYLLDTLIGAQLGAASTYNNAIGGSGLINNNRGNRTTYLERLPDIEAFQPTILVHGGYHNDDLLASLGISREERVAAILSYLRSFRAGCPHTTLFQFPAQTLGGDAITQGSTLHTLELDVIEAFQQWGDRNAVLIPLLTASQRFPASTSDGWYFQTAGSISELRDSHPTQRYYPIFAALVVSAVRTFYGVPA